MSDDAKVPGPRRTPVGMEMSPITLIEDRYSGAYSRGKWIAVAEHNEEYLPGIDRLHFVLDHDDGPFSDDLDAQTFWRRIAPTLSWIAVGNTPDEAIANLRTRYLDA
ncbi:hypothetical protein [Burkholderia sp. LMG 13014]|uniref:hypothetical protein n=1 Tax=Burkholderia sp. LMG 13014 TaxID=2709306 RepID=UPI001965DB1B|nr:hypothetical protein [Burkholderia sp. LMG 13014]